MTPEDPVLQLGSRRRPIFYWHVFISAIWICYIFWFITQTTRDCESGLSFNQRAKVANRQTMQHSQANTIASAQHPLWMCHSMQLEVVCWQSDDMAMIPHCHAYIKLLHPLLTKGLDF
jgi:hypothetical protein